MEVVVVVAVEEIIVIRIGANRRHHHAGRIDVAHPIILVRAMPSGGRVRRGGQHRAQCVHHLVGQRLGGPALTIDTRVTRPPVVWIGAVGLVRSLVDGGDPTHGTGLHEDQVLAIRAVIALTLQLIDSVGKTPLRRHRDVDLGDHEVAARVGHQAQVARTARLGRAGVENRIHPGDDGLEFGIRRVVRGGRPGRDHVEHLEAIAAGAIAVAGDPRRGGDPHIPGRCHRRPHIDPGRRGVGAVGAEIGPLDLVCAGTIGIAANGQPGIDQAARRVVLRHHQAGRRPALQRLYRAHRNERPGREHQRHDPQDHQSPS